MQDDFRPPSIGLRYCESAFEPELYAISLRVSEDAAFYQVFCQYMISIVADATQLVHFRAKVVNKVLEISEISKDLDLSVGETVIRVGDLVTRSASAQTDGAKRVAASMKDANNITWCALSLTTDRYFDELQRLSGRDNAEVQNCKLAWYDLLAMAFLPSTTNRRLDVKTLRGWVDSFLALHKH